ncbi:trypco2 family protein [Nocardia sp. NPDC019395]|uniref:trypco2 family protein n=1 Tax=Nocardia sp. NPDC019395 TaxID=3154686 RepID=UPI0033F67FD8
MEIELSDAVAALRNELLRAAAQGAGSGIGFLVGPIEMSFEVELRADAKVKGGFKAWVVTGDAEAGGSRARKHRVSLTLTPQLGSGTDLIVGAETSAEPGPGDVSGYLGR